jgi:hypothetical protein
MKNQKTKILFVSLLSCLTLGAYADVNEPLSDQAQESLEHSRDFRGFEPGEHPQYAHSPVKRRIIANRVKSMTPEERQAAREKFESMTPEERQAAREQIQDRVQNFRQQNFQQTL